MASGLVLSAPAPVRRRVEARLAGLPFAVELAPLRRRGPSNGDPFGVADLVLRSETGTGGVVVVVPDGPSVLAQVPGPVVHGVPVGVVPVSRACDIDPWMEAVAAPRGRSGGHIAVLSMWKPSYLDWAHRFAAALREGHGPRGAAVEAWPADEVGRDEVGRRLAAGPDFVLYVGHGRERGWSGYRGLRWRHVEAHPLQRPLGTLMTLTCSNLKWATPHEPPFGWRWIRSGRAGAFFGAVNEVRVRPLVLLSRLFTGIFASGRAENVGALLAAIDPAVRAAGDRELDRTWASFRLLGNPLQPVRPRGWGTAGDGTLPRDTDACTRATVSTPAAPARGNSPHGVPCSP